MTAHALGEAYGQRPSAFCDDPEADGMAIDLAAFRAWHDERRRRESPRPSVGRGAWTKFRNPRLG